MYAALITDTPWIDEELPQFKILVVGLIDEQVRVAQVVPQKLDLSEAVAFGERVTWADSDYDWLRRYRLSRLAPQLKKLGVNIIHALDERVWHGGLHLARTLNAPLVCAATAARDLDAAARITRRAGETRIAFTAATAPLGEALKGKLGPAAPVEIIAPGLHTPSQNEQPQTSAALCAVVTGNGKLDDDYQALLDAMAKFIQTYGDAQFFFDAHQPDQHTVWQQARKMNLLPNLSLVPRRLGHHELLLRADVLIQPQPLGQSRGLTLQAMARGIPVIARADRWLDYLHHDQSAWVVDSAEPNAWLRRLRMIVEQPADARALGDRARTYIGEHHKVVHQIDQIINLYRQVTGEAYKFDQASTG